MPTLMEAHQSAESKPSLKYRKVGDSALIAVTGYDELPDSNDDGTPKLTSRGDRAVIIIVSGLYVSGNVMAGKREDPQPVEVGEECSIWFGGARWWQFLQAKKAMSAPLNVGDMFSAACTSTEPPANPAHSPKLILDIKWGPTTKPELVPWVDKAMEVYRAAQAVELMNAAQAPSAGGSQANDVDPF